MPISVFTENRPWGKFERFTLNEQSSVKLLHVAKGKRLSLQYHNKREEYWVVVSGKVGVNIDGLQSTLARGQRVTVPVKSVHRLEGIEDSTVLELAFGEFDENDIVRVEDDFGRHSETVYGAGLRPVSGDASQRNEMFEDLIRTCRAEKDIDKRIELLHVINTMLPKFKRLTIPSLITGNYVDLALSRIEEAFVDEGPTQITEA